MFKEYYETGNFVVLESGEEFQIQPVYLEQKTPPKELTHIVCNCLKQELQEQQHFETSEDLLGRCHKNSTQLLKQLHEHGYEPELIIGGMDIKGETPQTVKHAFELKQVHQWVEVDGFIVEICSEYSQGAKAGQPYISPRVPHLYVELERLSFEEWDEMGQPVIKMTNFSDYF